MNINQIVSAIRSGVTGIHIQGHDLLRIDAIVNDIAKQLQWRVCEWNLAWGEVKFANKRPLASAQDSVLLTDYCRTLHDNSPEKKLILIKNVHTALNNEVQAAARLQHELLRYKRLFAAQTAIILVSREKLNSPDLCGLIQTFSCDPLAYEDVDALITTFTTEHSISLSTDVKNKLASICSGMEQYTVQNILSTLHNANSTVFTMSAVKMALSIKKKRLAQAGLLELIDTDITIDDIGGLQSLKTWLRQKKHIINDLPGAKAFGIVPPKGVLLVGIPGCGKSLSAKAAADLFQVPLLRLDIGSLMGKYVGESEANMRSALKVAEQASPCVLWIDELEKAFAGVNGTGGASDVTTRLFGFFLTWMQEKPGAVFVVATANDISALPTELLRRGRFDEIFYIGLPSEKERQQIFEVKLPKRSGLCIQDKAGQLAKKTEGFSGADITYAINDALEDAFLRQTSLNADTFYSLMERHIGSVISVSQVLSKKLENYKTLIEEYKLKSASCSDKDVDEAVRQSKSTQVADRIRVAANDLLPTDDLSRLARDDHSDVRKAVLSNANCPAHVLEDMVKHHKTMDFTQAGAVWDESYTSQEDLHLALRHRNMPGSAIVEAYSKSFISAHELMSLAHKLSSKEKKSVFQERYLKVPAEWEAYVVKNIHCMLNDYVRQNELLMDIDSPQGNTMRVTSPMSGIVRVICVKKHEKLRASHELVRILVPKTL